MSGVPHAERKPARSRRWGGILPYALAVLVTVGLGACAQDKEYVTPESQVMATDAFIVVGQEIVNVTPGHSHNSTMFCPKLSGQVMSYGMNWLRFDPAKRALLGHNAGRIQYVSQQTTKGGFTVYRKRGQCAWPGSQDETCWPDEGVAYTVVRVQPGTYVLSSFYMERAIPSAFINRTWVLSKDDLDDEIPFDPNDGTHVSFSVEAGETAYLGTYRFDFQMPASYPDDCMINLVFDWDEIRETRGPAQVTDIRNELPAVQKYMKDHFPQVPQPVEFRQPENVEILPAIAKTRIE